MDRAVRSALDLTGNQIKNVVLHRVAIAPSGRIEGQIYYLNGNKSPYFFDGASDIPMDAALQVGRIPLAALATNPLARINHTGTQVAATISDFSATVIAHSLSQFNVTADIDIKGFGIKNSRAPTAGTDLVNRDYVDALFQGCKTKDTATVVATAALPANNYSNGSAGVGATLTATANGALALGGYTVAVGDVVLVTAEAAALRNGLYKVQQVGSSTLPYILVRHESMNTAAEVAGALIAVEDAGTNSPNSLWLCTNTGAPVIGTTAITFTRLNNPTQIVEGNGIAVSGNTVSTKQKAGGGVAVDASGLYLDSTVVRKAAPVLIGDGASVDYVITHNLGTLDVHVSVREVGTGDIVDAAARAISPNQVMVSFGIAATANQYSVSVMG